MKQSQFNTYFLFSCIWFVSMLLIALTDEQRKFIENEVFLIVLFSSMLNIIILAFISTKKPIN